MNALRGRTAQGNPGCRQTRLGRQNVRAQERTERLLFALRLDCGQPEVFPILHAAAIPEYFVRWVTDFQ